MQIERSHLTEKFLWFVFVALSIIYLYILLDEAGLLVLMANPNHLNNWLLDLGYGGPAVIIGMMALAIIINPIPSAPIALVAGAMYGHLWGTIYVITGATIGALGAFSIARLLGYETIHRLFGEKMKLGWFGSQNRLMGMVFISRLIPFLSFDLISYGAGLTSIQTWRFVSATIVGLIPMSFLLTHYGGYLGVDSLTSATAIFLLLGGVTLFPLLLKGIQSLHKRFFNTQIQLLEKAEDKE